MPYASPSTQATGQVATAAYANSLKAGLDYLANPPACRVYNSANQSTANNVEVALTFDSERFDTDTMHSTSSNTSRITMTTAGVYVVSGAVVFAANATGVRQVGIRLGGATYLAAHLATTPASGPMPMNVSTVYKFTAGQYVELVTFQNSGGALNISMLGNYSLEFAATWIGTG